jgi:hypothetical protein
MRLLFAESVDYLIRDDRTSTSEGTKAQKNLFGGTLLRLGQAPPGKFREDPPCGFTFAARKLLGSLQNVVIDIKRGSHAPDAIA